MNRILITGQNGLLGSACVREFTRDHDVIRLPRIDFRNRDDTQALFNLLSPIDTVIHCAAKVGGVKANKEKPVEFLLDNLAMQSNVIEAAHSVGVNQLCFIGTSCMFPKDAALPVQESSLFTGKLEDSVEAYAIAKIAGWRLCKAYSEEYGSRFITVAPSNIYGPRDNYGDEAHVIPALIRRYHEAAMTNTEMEVWGDGSAVREFIYSDDVASAIRVAINHWHSPEVINIGTGISTTIRELLHAIADASPFNEKPSDVRWNTDAPVGIPRKTFSIERLSGLGWKPKIALADGLRSAWSDYLSSQATSMSSVTP